MFRILNRMSTRVIVEPARKQPFGIRARQQSELLDDEEMSESIRTQERKGILKIIWLDKGPGCGWGYPNGQDQ